MPVRKVRSTIRSRVLTFLGLVFPFDLVFSLVGWGFQELLDAVFPRRWGGQILESGGMLLGGFGDDVAACRWVQKDLLDGFVSGGLD